MSKYRVVVSYSFWRQLDGLVPALIAAIGFLVAPFSFWTHISPILAFSALLILLCLHISYRIRYQRPDDILMLDTQQNSVAFQNRNECQGAALAVTGASFILPWAVYLSLREAGPLSTLWIIRGEVSEADYRRLCRTVINARQLPASI